MVLRAVSGRLRLFWVHGLGSRCDDAPLARLRAGIRTACRSRLPARSLTLRAFRNRLVLRPGPLPRKSRRRPRVNRSFPARGRRGLFLTLRGSRYTAAIPSGVRAERWPLRLCLGPRRPVFARGRWRIRSWPAGRCGMTALTRTTAASTTTVRVSDVPRCVELGWGAVGPSGMTPLAWGARWACLPGLSGAPARRESPRWFAGRCARAPTHAASRARRAAPTAVAHGGGWWCRGGPRRFASAPHEIVVAVCVCDGVTTAHLSVCRICCPAVVSRTPVANKVQEVK
mgnify:CR=1 FL=1